MKSFSNMCQGDLIIIRDALKEAIKNQREVKLFTDQTSHLFPDQHLKYIGKMANHLQDIASKFTRIGELLVAIDDVLHQDDSE